MAGQQSAWGSVSPLLIFSCFCLLVGDMLFGFDTGSFGGILANPVSYILTQVQQNKADKRAQGFINQFGTYDAKSQTYAFGASQTSIMSSIPFFGKFVGCLFAGPAIEKYGHRMVFMILSIISCIGVISKCVS